MNKEQKIANILFGLIVLLTISTDFVHSQVSSTKNGGLSFRVDDNGLISQYRDYANLFHKYGSKFNFAMNLSNNEFETIGYADSIRKFQDLGHLMMDHTPSHATNFFHTKFNTSNYSGINGVDHIVNTKICLSHETIDTNSAIFSGFADLNGHTISFSSGDYHTLTHYQELDQEGRYFYFPALDTLLLVNSFNQSNKTGRAYDIWMEDVNFTENNSVKYFTFNREQVTITEDAFLLLVNETKKLCDSLYNLIPPTIWIQPGGHFPVLNSLQVKAPLESLGFTGAATYPDDAEKVYNEYNPNNDREFAFQWGDFVEDEMSLDVVKARIADGIAKHKVMINNIHWYSDDVGDWEGYLAIMDSLLRWADTNNIPINTYDHWIDKLYNQVQDPYENIIPPLNIDLDSNGTPDGYTNIYWLQTLYTGIWEADSTAPDGYAYSSNYYDEYRRITTIQDMGGIEKGENDFSIWTKGAAGNFVRVIVEFDSQTSPGSIEFKIPADTPEWRKYDLSQSINSNKSLIVPADASLINFDFVHKSTPISSAAEIRIAGMSLRKKIALDSLQLTVLNNESITVGDSILVEVALLDEFGNPVISSYNYNLTFPDTSTVELLTIGNLWFKNSSADTIIVRDTVSGFSSFSANLTDSPSITGQLAMTIMPSIPQSIKILSNTDPLIIGSQKLLQVALEDSFLNRIPDSLITFNALNGNGIFANNLQIDSSITNLSGVAEIFYTVSTSTEFGFDTIEVSYANTLFDTIIQPLTEAPINNISLNKISGTSFDNDTILIEITAKDIFDNLVINSENYLVKSTGSNTLKIFDSNNLSFNNHYIDTLSISDSLAGVFNLIVKLESDTLIADTITLSIEYSQKEIAIKTNLQAVYDSTSNTMAANLNSLIPLISPYIESLDTIIAVPDSIVDWVLVTLRKDVDPQSPNPLTSVHVASRSGFLTKFGNIIDPAIYQNLAFKVPEDWYYIVIKHRNHLPIMSSFKIYLTK